MFASHLSFLVNILIRHDESLKLIIVTMVAGMAANTCIIVITSVQKQKKKHCTVLKCIHLIQKNCMKKIWRNNSIPAPKDLISFQASDEKLCKAWFGLHQLFK